MADEVGLGKTLVARGIIARAIDHLWNDVERIDIVYICSNGSIARANLPKLQVGGAEERSFALATRLTMLATELARDEGESELAGSKLNFVSFTPGTSFKMGHSGGQGREREVLYQLLRPLVGPRTALMNLLQGAITKRDRFRERLKYNPRPIDDTIRQSFETASDERPDLQDRLRELLSTRFRRYRSSWPAEARHARDRLISDLRRLLAGACVKALEPDLVILDEFQRFKSLLGTQGTERDAAADLAQELFQAEAHDRKRVRTLLLSATPTSSTPRTRRSSTRSTTRISWPPLGSCSATMTPASPSSRGNCRASGRRCGARRPESRNKWSASSGRSVPSKTPCGT